MESGPVDVFVVAFGEPKFDGSIMAELQDLVTHGLIRVLDAMILVKGEDGTVEGLDIEDLPAEQSATLGFIETGTRGLFDSDDADMLKEGMVPGSAIVAIAIEQRWAIGLKNAAVEAGAEVAMSYRIPGPVVEDALNALGA